MVETWRAAQLIPTSGINGAQEQERRATSALLAVMGAVREFGRTLTQPLGAPAGPVQTYIEVPFVLGDRRVVPDGVIQIVRGKRRWTALVEVKTGQNHLAPDQLETYLDVAREQGFDAVLTISNQIPPVVGQHPTLIDRRKLHRVALHHLPWSQILTEAVVQKEYRGVADPDQAWILGELIRYLEHPRSGALEFQDMGPSWVAVRDAVAAGTLRAADVGVPEVAGRFDALLRHVCLRLGRQLGTDIAPALRRKHLADPATRSQAVQVELIKRGTMSGEIRIPGAVGPVQITADLRTGQITCQLDVEAPRTGRPTTRVNWLVRQLRDAPGSLRLEAHAFYARTGTAELLRDVRANPALLVADRRRELRLFRVAQTVSAGTKRGNGPGSFIASVTAAVEGFHQNVVQSVRAWTPAPVRPALAPDTGQAGPGLGPVPPADQESDAVAALPQPAGPAAVPVGPQPDGLRAVSGG